MGLPCVAPGPRPQNLQAQAWMEREVVNWLLPRSRPHPGLWPRGWCQLLPAALWMGPPASIHLTPYLFPGVQPEENGAQSLPLTPGGKPSVTAADLDPNPGTLSEER